MSQHPEHESPAERFARLMAEAEQARADAEALAAQDTAPSAALVPLAGGEIGIVPAEISKRQMAQVRATAIKKAAEVKEIQERMRAELEAQISAMNAVLAPLQKQVKQMEEGIWTINLYLGRDEEIVRLTEGEPAPADTVLTLRQEVLSMDEETAAYAEEGGIDARHIEVFDEWISRPTNLARVLPEPKGIVVLVPRKRGRAYGDPWMDERMAKENAWSYFLIRNGENLFRMKTDFTVGKHLIPGTKEFTDLFYETIAWGERRGERVPLVPGTREWEKAAERQDAKQRHYMRMALILQGLVDRTTVFHPLPAQGLNLLDDRTYASGAAHLLLDAEHVLTDGRPDFRTWLQGLNANLRPGMRIMGAFNTANFKDAGAEYTEHSSHGPGYYHAHDRITPRARSQWDAEKPKTGAIYRLEGTKDFQGVKGWYFKFERTQEREYRDEWGRVEYRAPKTKATCVILPGDDFVLPFDLVTVEDMRYYLGSRRQRHHYEEMFPLLKAAIAAKEDEAAQEAPFRALIAGALSKAHGIDPDEAAKSVPALVDWWKLANKWHRPLVVTDDPATEGKAIAAIVAEYAARQKATTASARTVVAEKTVVERLLAHDPSIMVIGRTRGGGYLAFAPQPRAYGERVAAQDRWVTEYTTTATGREIKTREWVLPGMRTEKTRLLHETETWATWDRFATATTDLTDPEIDALTSGLVETVLAEARTGWREWSWRGEVAAAPRDVLPLGVVHERDKQSIVVWMTDAADPAALAQPPRADTGDGRLTDLSYSEWYVAIRWTKTSKAGAALAPRDNWGSLREHIGGSYSSGGSPARPWGYHWNGKERGPGEIATFPEGQTYAIDRAERINRFRQAEKALHQMTDTALGVVRDGIRAIKERLAYEDFLADYADPDLWEGHVKTLRRGQYGDPFEPNFAGGRGYRGVPKTLTKALDMLVDAGVSHEGLTVRTAVEKAGLDVAAVAAEFDEKDHTTKRKPIPGETFLDLPIWQAPQPEPDDQPVAEQEPVEDAEQRSPDPITVDEEGHTIIQGVIEAVVIHQQPDPTQDADD